ncbi:hypothetical protein ACHAP5_011392 [Fusarium lateritium]
MADIKDIATQEWREAHKGSSLTSLPMVDFLLELGNIDYSEFVRLPKASLSGFQHKDILNAVWNELRSSTDNKRLITSGRCTILPIQAMQQIELKCPGKTHFQMYDVGFHRLARCTFTYLVLDSSNNNAEAFIQAPGTSYNHKAKSIRSTIQTVEPISKEKAITECLKEVADRQKAVTYFRDYNEKKGAFFKGFMEWYIEDDRTRGKAKKFLVLMPSRSKPDAVTRIVWQEGHPNDNPQRPPSDQKSMEALGKFITRHGSWAQWRLNGCNIVNRQIWESLNSAYGIPVVRYGWGPHEGEKK